MKNKERIIEILFLCGCALLFIYPAFLNGYPLVTSDTGTYISSGIYMDIPFDRPIIYGIFLRHSSLKETLWLPIFFQGLIVAWILSQTIKQFTPSISGRIHRLIIFLLLSLFTPIAWFCSQLMADIFSPVSVLCLGLLFFANGQTKFQKGLTIFLFFLSTLTHNSHLLVVTISFILFSAIYFFKKIFFKSGVPFKKISSVLLLVFSCWILAPLINFLVDHKFRYSGSPHVFLIARMAESGILEDYLMKNCGCKSPCQFNDSTRYLIVSKSSKKTLEIGELQMHDGVTLHQWHYVEGANQKFYLTKVKDDLYKIKVNSSNKLISVLQDGQSKLAQFSDSNGIGQIFKINELNDHSFTIVYPSTNQVFELVDSSIQDGAQIQLGNNINKTNQQFWIYPESTWRLCLYKDEIPRSAIGFIWADNGLFWRTGGWENSGKEYKSILKGIFFSPRYFVWQLREAITSTLRQLVHFDIGDGLYKYDQYSPPGGNIYSHYRHDITGFTYSIQNTYGYNFFFINRKILGGLIISLVIFVLYFGKGSNREENRGLWYFCMLCFIAIVVNAFVSGTLANVLDRLQSRIVFIIPFCALLIAYEPTLLLLKRIKKKLENAF